MYPSVIIKIYLLYIKYNILPKTIKVNYNFLKDISLSSMLIVNNRYFLELASI